MLSLTTMKIDEVASFLKGKEQEGRRQERGEALFTDRSIIQSILQRRERPRVTAFCVAGGKTGSGLPDLRGSRGRNARGAEGKGPQLGQTSAGYSRPPGSVRNPEVGGWYSPESEDRQGFRKRQEGVRVRGCASPGPRGDLGSRPPLDLGSGVG